MTDTTEMTDPFSLELPTDRTEFIPDLTVAIHADRDPLRQIRWTTTIGEERDDGLELAVDLSESGSLSRSADRV